MIHGDLLGERARLTPGKTSLVYVPTGERLTYRQLDQRAVRLARVWREGLGMAKGDRFALLADNRIEYLDALFAAPKAGVVLVPLGTRLTPRELAGILEDARPAGLLYGAEHAETVRALQDLISLDHWIALDEPAMSGHDADGWFHTGDLARRDADGFHYIAGRKKDMIISGGVNVYPAEIEGELLLHPQVRDAAVVGIPHPTWGEAGVAFVVPGAEPPSHEDLAAFLGARLAKYKIPRELVFVEALPRTAYGKVVKGELRERYLKERQLKERQLKERQSKERS